MEKYKQRFIEFMVECGVLSFGDFVTKSGRETPFFINTGNYNSGHRLFRLGEFYAQALVRHLGSDYSCLFGPAYKGIPLVAAVSTALYREHDIDVNICFNRKEQKDHGEGGGLIGHTPAANDRIVIVEDVTTAGTSVRETVPLLKAIAPVQICALLVSVDRQEKGTSEKSALRELREEFGLKPIPIVNLDEIIVHLSRYPVGGKIILDSSMLCKIEEYRKKHGGELGS